LRHKIYIPKPQKLQENQASFEIAIRVNMLNREWDFER